METDLTTIIRLTIIQMTLVEKEFFFVGGLY